MKIKLKSCITKSLRFALYFAISINLYSQQNKFNYPEIEPDSVVEKYFGDDVIDYYRNMENMQDTTNIKWYEAQKTFYNTILNNISGRDSLKKEYAQYESPLTYWTGLPRPIGEKLFFSRYSYIAESYSLCFSNTLSDSIYELFSLDSMNTADDAFYVIDFYEPSYNTNYVALGLSSGGDENSSIYIFDIKNKKLLPERIENAMGGNPQWLPDNKGFFYQEYIKTKLENGSYFSEKSVRLHILNTPPISDKKVLSKEVSKQLNIDKLDFPLIYTNKNSNKILAALNHGSGKYSTLFYATLTEVLNNNADKIKWTQLFSQDDLISSYYLEKDELFFLSKKNHAKGQIEYLNIHKPNKRKTIAKYKDKIIESMVVNRNGVFFISLDNGIHRLAKIEKHTKNVYEIKLPFLGSIHLRPYFEVNSFFQDSEELFFKSFSWNRDLCILKYNTETNNIVNTYLIPEEEYSSLDNLEINQINIPSHDNTLVPLTIIYSKEINLNGENPTMIEAYGCYGYSFSPNFVRSRLSWLKRGGIYAVAHVRGGGEKGEDWYRDGYKKNKPNSWKDLISCSEYLVEKNYTSKSKLACAGTSCGGIAIGRAITERPDLFKAAVISSGRLNTLRHEFEQSNSSVQEYGTIKDSLDFQNLYEMDVTQHIKSNTTYPSILFASGLNDPRVAPWQSGKAVACFQSNKSNNNIILYYISKNGHSDFTESIDSYTFLLWQLGHKDFKLIRKQ